MKKKIWRLKESPTVLNVLELLGAGVITKDEADSIIFNPNEDTKSLEDEIKFLRELVNKISNRTQIVETIRTIEKPYYQHPWYTPYTTWCGTSGNISSNGVVPLINNTGSTAVSGTSFTNLVASPSFTEIKTF